MKVLVLGGYGHFGAIVARALAADGAFEVIVAGRHRERAERFAQEIGIAAARLDREAPAFADELARIAPQLVISTAGPFQSQDYRVAEAAIRAGAHYADLADATAFVCGIGALDARARAKGVLVVSGASSVPALSAAVVDHFIGEFTALESIEEGISTSQSMPGIATVRAILGACGRSIPRWRDGRWSAAHGWQGLRRHRFRRPAFSRWFCDVDVPDVRLFPERYSPVPNVRFGAGMELAVAHLGLWALSGMARAGLMPRLDRFARPLQKLSHALRPLASGRSAMFVVLRGVGRDGERRTRLWELVAESDRGAAIPYMAAVALARSLASGKLASRGAMPCVGLLTLDEYLRELDGLPVAITTATDLPEDLKTSAQASYI